MPKTFAQSFVVSIKDMIQQMKDGEIRLVAAALAFSCIVSLVPFMAVTLSIFKSYGGLEFLYPKVEAFILSYLEQGTSKQAVAFIQKIFNRIHVGVLGTTGAVALLFSSFKLLQDMERGVNRVWNIKEKRPFFRSILLSLTLFILFPMALAIYGSFRSLAFFKPFFRSDANRLLDFLMLFVGLILFYKLVPYLKVKMKPAIVSALLASVLMMGLNKSVTWFASKVFNYSKVYGSMAAVPIFCLWILGVWYIVLGGVAFCASSQKRRWLEETYKVETVE